MLCVWLTLLCNGLLYLTVSQPSQCSDRSTSVRTQTAEAVSGPQEWQSRGQPTDQQIINIAGEACQDWRKISMHLPDARPGKELAFALRDHRIVEIKRMQGSDLERMVDVLYLWRSISHLHTCSLLNDCLQKMGYGAVAQRILTKQPPK